MKTQKQTLRYVMVTPIIGGVDLGLYYLLNRICPYTLAKALSYLTANLIGYVCNKYWIFECKRSSAPEAGRYVIVEVVLFFCNVASNHLIRYCWPGAVLRAVLAASVITAILSFILKKCWVFDA